MYVYAVKHAGLIFLSRLTAFGTPTQGHSLAKQTEAIFSQIKSVASAKGTGLEALLKVTIFITGFESIAQLQEVPFKEYGENLPASSLVQAASLFSPEINVEIEAVLASLKA